jgi:hypothetical protein
VQANDRQPSNDSLARPTAANADSLQPNSGRRQRRQMSTTPVLTGWKNLLLWTIILMSWLIAKVARSGELPTETMQERMAVERLGHPLGLTYAGIIWQHLASKSPKEGPRDKLELFLFLTLARHGVEHIYHELAYLAYDKGFADYLPFLAITEVTTENGLFNGLNILVIPLIFGFSMFGFPAFFRRLFEEQWNIRLAVITEVAVCGFYGIRVVSNVIDFATTAGSSAEL